MVRAQNRQNSGPDPDSLIGVLGAVRDNLADPANTSLPTEVGRAACRALSSSPFSSGGAAITTSLGAGYACEPYLTGQGWDLPTETAPFTGGQCPTDYEVIASTEGGANGPGEFSPFVTILGPVTGYSFEASAPYFDRGFFRCDIVVRATAGDGEQRVFSSNGIPLAGDSPLVNTSTRVVRKDGQPDDCGNPPSEQIPGPSNPGQPYGTTQPTGGGGPNVTVEAPFVDLSGSVFFPVTIEDNGVVIVPEFNFSFGGAEPSLPDPSTEPPSKGDPVDLTDDGGEIEDDLPDEEQEQVTIGYEWEFSGEPSRLWPVPGSFPSVRPTVIGNIRLRYESEQGETIWGDNVRIYTDQGSIIRPDASLRVVGFTYTKRPDFPNARFTPIRALRSTTNG